jgi:phosphoribosylformimino-5-aminoimidazole carboxamide ribotide isomerase
LQKTYSSDPVAQAKEFEEAGATWVHVVDLDGARTGEMTQLEMIRGICEGTGLRVQVGGGIRSTGVVDRLFSCGVERVVLGTAALRDWSWFEGLVSERAYADRLVLGLDAREGRLAVQGWEEATELTAEGVAARVSGWALGAIVYTDISTDGTMAGPNFVGTRRVAESTSVPVIASGGVGTLADLRALRGLPVAGVIVGRALYERRFTLGEAIGVIERDGA